MSEILHEIDARTIRKAQNIGHVGRMLQAEKADFAQHVAEYVAEPEPGWKTRDMLGMAALKGVEIRQLDVLDQAANVMAGELHNAWRDENFKNEDGTYRPRIKCLVQCGTAQKWVNQDQVTKEDTLLFEQDIANTAYEDLHPHWQNDNKQAADFVVGLLVQYGRKIDLQNEAESTWAGNEVHNAWLNRASWVEPGLEVPFSALQPEQQAKDLQQIAIANDLFF